MNSSTLPTITPSPEPKKSPFLLIAVVIAGVFCITFGYVAGSFQLIPKIVEKIGAKNGVACTMEAKLCPDGSYVGRSGPKCEFTPCPSGSTTSQDTCTTNSDCRIVLNNAWNDCALLNSCDPIDYSLDSWIAVNGGWFDSMTESKCPDLKLMGNPGCESKPVNDRFEAVCLSNKCMKQPIGPQPTEVAPAEKLSCTQDADCAVDSCTCGAVNKKFLPENQCAMACSGTASCLEGTCQFIHFPD